MNKEPHVFFEYLHRLVWICGALGCLGFGMLISFNKQMAIRHEIEAVKQGRAELLISLPLVALSQVTVEL